MPTPARGAPPPRADRRDGPPASPPPAGPRPAPSAAVSPPRPSPRVAPALRAALTGALLCLPLAPAAGACARIEAELAALGRPGGGRQGAAAAAQRGELARTEAAMAALGCGRARFLFLGPEPPARCGPLGAHRAAQAANLAALEAGAAREAAAPGAQRAELLARLDAGGCRGGESSARVVAIAPPDEAPGPAAPSGEAVCVRACDGYFFPMGASAAQARRDGDAVCRALCPAGDARAYLKPPAGTIEAAATPDGEPYADHPAAGRYLRARDPACGCRAPGQGWADALREAEAMMTPRRGDRVVVEDAPGAGRPAEGGAGRPEDDAGEPAAPATGRRGARADLRP